MDRKDTPQQPARTDSDEAGIHKSREAPRRDEARTPTEGEPQSDADRQGKQETPASTPRR
jgi:hypothetical protein